MCNRFDSFRGLRLVLCGLVSVVTCFHSLGFPRLRAADPRHLENFLGFFLALLLLLRAQIEFSMAHNSEFISAIISSPPCLDYLWFFLRTTPPDNLRLFRPSFSCFYLIFHPLTFCVRSTQSQVGLCQAAFVFHFNCKISCLQTS